MDAEGTHTINRTETIAAARGPDNWHFQPVDVSSFFLYIVTEAWASRIYADYYRDFWQPVLDRLEEDERSAVQIELDCEYTFGTESEDTIKQYMGRWVKKEPGMMTVQQQGDNGNPHFAHLWIKSFHIGPLTARV